MKTYRLNQPVGMLPASLAGVLASDTAPDPRILDVSLVPDSALVTRGRPLFLPDFVDAGWRLCVAPMFRIGRLGKYIEPRFAHRYVDGVGLCATLLPPAGSGGVSALEAAFDGSLAVGIFSDISQAVASNIGISMLGISAFGHTVTAGGIRLAEILALLSRFSTLRTGDIVIPGLLPELAFTPQIDAEVSASGRLSPAPGCDWREVWLPQLCFRLK